MKRLSSARVALAFLMLATLTVGSIVSAQRAVAGSMTTAAERLLASLSAEQRQQAVFAFESDERLRWNFIPTEAFPRKGLLLKDMTESQRTLAHNLLKTGLSERGYLTYTQIIQLENVLLAVEKGGKFVRDPLGYRVTVFGTPSAEGAWGWRVEGHHISLHFSVVNGSAVASTPSFAGSNPAEVREGPQKGQRVLALLEDSGRALVTALDATQRTTAVINLTAPNEIVTNNTLDINPLSPDGLKASAMTPAQRDLLLRVIDAYAGLMTADIAAERLAKIKAAGVDNIGFAWAGPVERGQRHYYRVQGPTFLIEFDNAQNDGNHVHSVWRDFNGDFGRDLLREHLRTARHD
ncbi:MAG TPA: DUF3500 domain-containing protein [Vicinamibacterales bacterium]|nr:DUF3500 domain-containing protein [Vicinamibacterales bacterium]